MDRVLLAYHLGQGRLPPRLGPLKALLTALTLGLGGSGGQEGPLLYAGGALAQALRPRNPAEARAVLLAGGVAAIAALFHTPLGAAFFAAEVLYRGSALEGRLLGYLAVAAISGYGLQSLFFGTRPLLPVQGLEAPPLGFALALAPLAALGAWALVSAAARTPFAAVVQMVEITGSYALLVPGLLVAFGAFALNRETLFPLQPSGPEASPAHAEDLLRGLAQLPPGRPLLLGDLGAILLEVREGHPWAGKPLKDTALPPGSWWASSSAKPASSPPGGRTGWSPGTGSSSSGLRRRWPASPPGPNPRGGFAARGGLRPGPPRGPGAGWRRRRAPRGAPRRARGPPPGRRGPPPRGGPAPPGP